MPGSGQKPQGTQMSPSAYAPSGPTTPWRAPPVQNLRSQEPRAQREGGRAQRGQARLGGLQLVAEGGERSGEAVVCAFGSASWRAWWGQPWGCGLTRMDALQDLGSLRLFARRRESGYRSSSHPAPLWDLECPGTFLHV